MTLREAKAPALETTDIGGHRHRLRDRLIRGGPEALADFEVLEVLLFAAMPRGDTKALAKSLIAQFGSLGDVLSAPPEALVTVKGVGQAAVAAIAVVRKASRRLAAEQIADKPLLSSFDALLEYCRLHHFTYFFRYFNDLCGA